MRHTLRIRQALLRAPARRSISDPKCTLRKRAVHRYAKQVLPCHAPCVLTSLPCARSSPPVSTRVSSTSKSSCPHASVASADIVARARLLYPRLFILGGFVVLGAGRHHQDTQEVLFRAQSFSGQSVKPTTRANRSSFLLFTHGVEMQ